MCDLVQSCVDEKQLARLWGISPRTLSNWRYKKMGPPYVRIGRSVRYPLLDAFRWLRSPEGAPFRRFVQSSGTDPSQEAA